MKHAFFALSLALATAHPAMAQDEEDGLSLMERGVQQFLEGLLQEMEPAVDGIADFFEQMGPALVELLDEIKDWSVYEPPEMLDNGDIIIRRKPEKKPELVPRPDPVPQIEL